jgi:ketosteroid isomerase-like protein
MITRTRDETAVRDVLTEHVDALRDGDAERALAVFADEPVRYDLAPPLRQPSLPADEAAAGLRGWLATFDGPVEIAFRDSSVLVDGDLAAFHGLTSMTATPVGEPEPFTLWFRSTYVLRRTDERWRIVHEHESVPFHMDGSFRAATELDPA